MSIKNFIPTVWSESLLQMLDKNYVAVLNCNREYEGEIREKGNSVQICGLNPISVSDYYKNSNMSAPTSIVGYGNQIVIDQAKYFNFQIDDIDKVQSNPPMMETALKAAAEELCKVADTYVYSLINNTSGYYIETDATCESILDLMIDARTRLLNKGVNDPSEIVLEVTPGIAALILKAKMNLSSDNSAQLEHGCIGSIGGSKVFVSSQLLSDEGNETTSHQCFARTRRAVAFAEQLSEVEAYRPELRFADAMKGLHLYGATVVRPEEIVRMQIRIPI